MKPVLKKTEAVANIAVIILAVVLSGVLIKRFLIPDKIVPVNLEHAPKIGATVKINGVDWVKNGQTLLIALSNNCHYCTESAPLYRKLIEEKSKSNKFRVLAILPQPVDEGKQYLSKIDVLVDEVIQMPLGDLGIRGTPSIMLVNEEGLLEGFWIGKLPPNKESEIFVKLQSYRP